MFIPNHSDNFYQYECLARQAGHQTIAGIDEVGRGPLAGPVVAAAVILPSDTVISGLNDSKKLTPAQRDDLFTRITNLPGVVYALAEVSAADIDRLNILQATHLTMRLAAQQLPSSTNFIFVDGLPVPGLPFPSQNIIKGDAKCACIAAASIIAKVYRDRLMTKFDDLYPGYGFARHKGYATRHHLTALSRNGPCPIHRRSFSPVARHQLLPKTGLAEQLLEL